MKTSTKPTQGMGQDRVVVLHCNWTELGLGFKLSTRYCLVIPANLMPLRSLRYIIYK